MVVDLGAVVQPSQIHPGVFAALRHLGAGPFPAGIPANRRLRLVPALGESVWDCDESNLSTWVSRKSPRRARFQHFLLKRLPLSGVDRSGSLKGTCLTVIPVSPSAGLFVFGSSPTAKPHGSERAWFNFGPFYKQV